VPPTLNAKIWTVPERNRKTVGQATLPIGMTRFRRTAFTMLRQVVPSFLTCCSSTTTQPVWDVWSVDTTPDPSGSGYTYVAADGGAGEHFSSCRDDCFQREGSDNFVSCAGPIAVDVDAGGMTTFSDGYNVILGGGQAIECTYETTLTTNPLGCANWLSTD
jgi:hypothetical protein